MEFDQHSVIKSGIKESAERRTDRLCLLLFLIWPFAGATVSFFRIHRKASLFIIGLFCLLFGLSFTPVNDQLDSFRYAQEFSQFLLNPQGNFTLAISDFFSGDIKDIYSAFCYYVASLMGGDIHALFFIISIGFAFFQLKSVRIIVDQPSVRNDSIFLILAFLVIYSNSIFNINGFRYWTAAWIGVYATLKILVEDKKSYAILLLLTPLVHGSFWVYIGFVAVAYFIKIGVKPLLIAFFVSFFFTELILNNLGIIDESLLPTYMQNLLYSYTESETAQGKIAGANIEDQPLYWKILTNLPRYYELFMVALLAVKSKYFSDRSVRIIKFLLLYLTITNLFSAIPSFVRFYFPMVPILAYVWIKERNMLYQQRKWVYAVPIVILYGAFQLARYVMSVTDFTLFSPSTVIGIILKVAI